MSIKKDDLKRIVNNFLKVLENKEIQTLLDFERPKKIFPITNDASEYVSVEFRPSSTHIKAFTKSPTISYIIEGCGIPLEVRINSYEGYSRIILKTVEGVFHGYSPFTIDKFNNIAQDKMIYSTDISLVKEELKKLLNL
ncbi:MAG: hypothetical protein QXD55_00120 [Candidatus Aenigmatarchaeota archaeon]